MSLLQIELTQGFSATVSPEDYPALSAVKWHAVRCGAGKLYARRGNVYMHRHLMAKHLDEGLVVDHINGDSLDNRRENLRAVLPAKNSLNKQKFTSPTGYRGVFLQKGKYIARIANHYMGSYETAEEAALVANERLEKLDSSVGMRNEIDYGRLLAVLEGRRDAIEAQLAKVRKAMQ